VAAPLTLPNIGSDNALLKFDQGGGKVLGGDLEDAPALSEGMDI
jgi:hypothetical protein